MVSFVILCMPTNKELAPTTDIVNVIIINADYFSSNTTPKNCSRFIVADSKQCLCWNVATNHIGLCYRRNGTWITAEYDYPPLSFQCGVVSWFWITWRNGLLTVGQGQIVGQKAMFNYMDPSPLTINCLAVATGVSGSNSNWTIPAAMYTNGGR